MIRKLSTDPSKSGGGGFVKAESQQSILIESVKGRSRISLARSRIFQEIRVSDFARDFKRKRRAVEARLFDGFGPVSGGFACGDPVAG